MTKRKFKKLCKMDILHSRMKKRALSMKPIYLCLRCKDTGFILLDGTDEFIQEVHEWDHCDCDAGQKLCSEPLTFMSCASAFASKHGETDLK